MLFYAMQAVQSGIATQCHTTIRNHGYKTLEAAKAVVIRNGLPGFVQDQNRRVLWAVVKPNR